MLSDEELGSLAIDFLLNSNPNYKYEFSHIKRNDDKIIIIMNWYSKTGGFMDGPILLYYDEKTKKIINPLG